MSLASVMLGMAVVAGIAASVSRVVVLSKKTAETAVIKSEFQLLQAQMRAILLSEKSCRIALGGSPTYTPTNNDAGDSAQTFNTATGAYTVIKLYQDNAGTVFLDPNSATQNRFGRLVLKSGGAGQGNAGIQLISGGPAPGTDGTNGAACCGGGACGAALWNANCPLNTFSTNSGAGGVRTYLAYLYLNVQTPGENGQPGPLMSNLSNGSNNTNLALNVRVDGSNRILSCSAISFWNGGTSTQTFPVCGSDQALVRVGSQLKCVKIACPNPAHRTGNRGFKQDGVFKVKASGDINCDYMYN